MEEEKLGQCPPKVYVVPVHKRYKVIPTSDTRFYIYDYMKYTTVTDENGKTRLFGSSFNAHQEYNRLTAAYQREYQGLVEAAEKRIRGES